MILTLDTDFSLSSGFNYFTNAALAPEARQIVAHGETVGWPRQNVLSPGGRPKLIHGDFFRPIRGLIFLGATHGCRRGYYHALLRGFKWARLEFKMSLVTSTPTKVSAQSIRRRPPDRPDKIPPPGRA